MKIINVLYRGGAGGEFFGGLLVKHPEIATKELKHDPEKERWHLERDDLISSHFEMNAKTPNWDKNLWNLRLDHGYGFPKQPEFWIDYLWNNWKETRTLHRSKRFLEQMLRLLRRPSATLPRALRVRFRFYADPLITPYKPAHARLSQ